ncbi:hypothetical protein N7449_004388 [Penicillium cf. viridicatum]|uniref:Uncharacterized protein n=1 Tax=Penicillium cf. viridicatum TaxID=2972119 RepID=A0A9W9SXX6_9EURO|nr:hypothetical protein N7449_004388 [Penicillium cf. viridicatum]
MGLQLLRCNTPVHISDGEHPIGSSESYYEGALEATTSAQSEGENTSPGESGINEAVSPPEDTISFSGLQQNLDINVANNREKYSSIPAQLLCGVSYALPSSKPDPFQTCPVHLTSQHQKLLHHWISTHAAIMFVDLDVTEFNPRRDVWFPLDLSNASSFNCIIAHSAARLSHLYTGTPPRRGSNSSGALKYKIEAVRILRLSLSNPEKELSDDSFAAVIRLLTFEGTEADWKIHRDGLQRMIEAKGGVEVLHENWRLELVVYLRVQPVCLANIAAVIARVHEKSRTNFSSSFLTPNHATNLVLRCSKGPLPLVNIIHSRHENVHGVCLH